MLKIKFFCTNLVKWNKGFHTPMFVVSTIVCAKPRSC